MAIERWRHEEREHREMFVRQPFVSIDPGSSGWALAWTVDEPTPAGFCHALDPMAMVELFALVGAQVAVVEAQYISSLKNARSILELAFRSGMSLGWLAAALHTDTGDGWQRPGDLNLFEVAPATWQAHQRRLAGIGRRLERGEGIRLALEFAENTFAGEAAWKACRRREQREGMASALGLGVWWRSLWEGGVKESRFRGKGRSLSVEGARTSGAAAESAPRSSVTIQSPGQGRARRTREPATGIAAVVARSESAPTGTTARRTRG